jgi:hypothetical protein
MRAVKRTLTILFTAMLAGCGGAKSDSGTENIPSNDFQSPLTISHDLTIQLAVDADHPLQLPTRSAVMEVDLFDTPDEAMATIKRQSLLLCYFSAGSYENWRDDADQYPNEILGNDYDGWAGEKWVDIRSPELKSILQARFDKAVERDCDGVDPDNVNGYQNDTGFNLTAQDQLDFNRWLAEQAHQRNLFIALKNDGEQASKLVNEFDAVVSEQCHQYNECGLFDDFIAQNKPVWDIEYRTDTFDYANGDVWNAFCQTSNAAHRHGYWLPGNLDGSFRRSCQADAQMWNDLSFGFGGRSSFPFAKTDGNVAYLPAKELILNPTLGQSSYLDSIVNVNRDAFQTLHQDISNADFIVMWANQGWQPSWFNHEELSELANAGKGMVFNYWYFGDEMIRQGFPDDEAQQAYLEDAQRLGEYLATIPGPKFVNLEPEFNKQAVLESAETQQAFIQLMKQAIQRLKTADPQIRVSLTMLDHGRRESHDTSSSCGYANCALGDQQAWAETAALFNGLTNELDYLSFQQMVGQFSRDPLNPSTWDAPNPKAFSDDETAIDVLAQRLANFASYLHQTYHKPVMLPYVGIATATWQDDNNNGKIDSEEIDPNGWTPKLIQFLSDLRSPAIERQFKNAQTLGIAMMELIDHPQHDGGGYRFFLENENHLGMAATGAQSGVDAQPDGDLQIKSVNRQRSTQLLFQLRKR